MLEMNATVIVENEQNANHLILFETKKNSNYILQMISFCFLLNLFVEIYNYIIYFKYHIARMRHSLPLKRPRSYYFCCLIYVCSMIQDKITKFLKLPNGLKEDIERKRTEEGRKVKTINSQFVVVILFTSKKRK